MWAAVLERDSSHDGQFVFAVLSTGIYCRPSCPARRPRRENTRFYVGIDEAESKGFRACKRCHPDSLSIEERRLAAIRNACELIDDAIEPIRTPELADKVGLSSSHFHRIFKSLVGVTPREYAAGKRVKRLQQRLKQEGRVTDAIFDAGFGSASRAYSASKSTLGMTHSEYRAGGPDIAVEYATARTQLGWLLVGATEKGVCAVELGDSRREVIGELKEHFPAARLRNENADLKIWIERIVSFIQLPSARLELPLDVHGTAFQRKVWRALQQIPIGETATYQEVALKIGDRAAARAVANACAANTLAMAIPCHRVVRSDGSVGGYRWGTDRKRELLERESTVSDVRRNASKR
jgi:AraC family transcriptional regulator of adaptative response/methylated-DNA-[protein]-cysteine methyltransferase